MNKLQCMIRTVTWTFSMNDDRPQNILLNDKPREQPQLDRKPYSTEVGHGPWKRIKTKKKEKSLFFLRLKSSIFWSSSETSVTHCQTIQHQNLMPPSSEWILMIRFFGNNVKMLSDYTADAQCTVRFISKQIFYNSAGLVARRLTTRQTSTHNNK
jgi:hypothetical protein